MDELENSSPSHSNDDCNSSFQSMRLSGDSLPGGFNENDPFELIQDAPDPSKLPEKSLKESVRQKYKMCYSGIITIKTNIAYNLRHSTLDIFKQRQKVILNKNSPAILLGKVYQNNSKDKQKFYTDFNNVIWLTYRNGISGIQSDVGWGCMIRVCQMLLAECFKRLAPKFPLKQIINYFRDTQEAYFSLTRICEKGQIKERWTSSIEIFTLLGGLLQKFTDIPLRIDINSTCIQINSLEELERIEYPILLFISNRLAKYKLDKLYKDHLLDLMGIPSFVGAVGGNGGEALYLIGSYCQKVIFMDPHYVQSSENEDNDQKTSTYFQSEPYCLNVQSLAPSIAFTFLINSKQQYSDLLRQLYLLQTKHQPWVCFQTLCDQITKNVQPQKHKDDIFEIIV